MNLEEIFDSNITGIMQQRAWGWHGAFQWGENTFTVELRKRSIEKMPRKARAYEASFFLSDVKNDDAFSTADVDGHPKNHEVPVKVYGVVLNALLSVWKNNDIDAMYFTAEPRHANNAGQHMRKEFLYESLARRAQRQGGGYLYVHRGHFTAWVLSKNEIIDDHWVNVLQEALIATSKAGRIIPRI